MLRRKENLLADRCWISEEADWRHEIPCSHSFVSFPLVCVANCSAQFAHMVHKQVVNFPLFCDWFQSCHGAFWKYPKSQRNIRCCRIYQKNISPKHPRFCSPFDPLWCRIVEEKFKILKNSTKHLSWMPYISAWKWHILQRPFQSKGDNSSLPAVFLLG